MICHKCGAKLPDNAIRCDNCGIRVNMVCPECKTLNSFGAHKCGNCGFELIKKCMVCGSANIYYAAVCRKCGNTLEEEKSSSEVVSELEKPSLPPKIMLETKAIQDKANTIFEQEYIPKKKKEKEPVQKEACNDEIEVVLPFSCNQSSFTRVNPPVVKVPQKSDIPDTLQPLDGVEKNKEPQDKIFIVENKDDTPVQTQEEELPEQDNAVNPPVEDNAQAAEIVPEEDELLKEDIEIETLDEDTEDYEVSDIEQEQEAEINNAVNNPMELDNIEIQQEAVKKAVELIKKSITKHIISINGKEGSGKTAVLKQVKNYFTADKYVVLYGSCTPLLQITSFGFFQDAFLRILGFPPYTNNIESFRADFKNSNLEESFNFLSQKELNLFLNIFYPAQKDYFENIIENKKIMFQILEKVIKSFLLNNNIVIVIDNFELLDGASYDFLIYMLEKGCFNNRLKLLVAYQENKSIQSYFDIADADENMFEMILTKNFDRNTLLKAVNHSIGFPIEKVLPPDYLNELVKKSQGNAIRLEQEIALLFDTGYVTVKENNVVLNDKFKPEEEPFQLNELIKLRLNSLTPSAKNVLFMAAIMGYRFAHGILTVSVSMPVEKTEEIFNFLKQELFINQIDNYTCEFKSLTLWKLIYKEAKSDLLYKENAERIYKTLQPLILSSNLQKLISCTEALTKQETYDIWQDTAQLTAKLGDTNLYVIAQKQMLKLLDTLEKDNSDDVKSEIYEEIGKLLYEKSPAEAVTYLANVLDTEIKDCNIRKVIDLSGYFVKSCYLSGNYFGANESIDAVIKLIESTAANVSELDIALIKTRKLKALFNIGNSAQVISIINDEIIPRFEEGLNAKSFDNKYKSLIIDAWLTAKIVLAKAYSLQGNDNALIVISDLRKFLELYDCDTEYYNTRIDIIEAFASTIMGEINKSNDILNKTAAEYKNKNLPTELLAEWNLVNVINRVLLGQNNDLKADLFELAAFANNINEHFIKHIIKLILGYVIKEEGNVTRALEIFNEEITYFAKEKVATGALLSWLLIVQITMEMGDDDKALDTAMKSLDIAKSLKINNYFFTIYFQKCIAEIYMRKNDLTAVKMYLEQSVMIAKQFNLKYQLIELHIAYAKYLEALMESKRIYSNENVTSTSEMYDKALAIAKELQLPNMIEIAARERNNFKNFCQLNSIEV